MKISEPRIDYKLEKRIYNLKKDVDFIYDHAFKEFIQDFHSELLKPLEFYGEKSLGRDFKFVTFSTKELKAKECKIADSKLSVPIFCGVFDSGNFFNFSGDKPYIQLSLHSVLVHSIYSNKIENIKGMKYIISNTQLKKAKNEFDEGRIKGSIAHELSHWVDGANYDIFNKIVSKNTELSRQELLKLKNKSVDMSYFEIQGQIHGISELKRKYKKQWNDMSLNDLFNLYTSLSSIANTLYKNYGSDVVLIWSRNLIKRLAREGLLGVNMKLTSDVSQLLEDISYRI